MDSGIVLCPKDELPKFIYTLNWILFSQEMVNGRLTVTTGFMLLSRWSLVLEAIRWLILDQLISGQMRPPASKIEYKSGIDADILLYSIYYIISFTNLFQIQFYL